MSNYEKTSLEDRVQALEEKCQQDREVIVFMMKTNLHLAEAAFGLKPLSPCESDCQSKTDTSKRLNCMLKCVADGK